MGLSNMKECRQYSRVDTIIGSVLFRRIPVRRISFFRSANELSKVAT